MTIDRTFQFFPRPVDQETLTKCVKGINKRLRDEKDYLKRYRLSIIKSEINLLKQQL